ncbi:copper resistance protein [Ralstonia syzygii]|uniref:Copper resistance protein n=1 Tax=Ralstonia syzygii R24 TaxID=907261 RepID=G3A9R8_9RALS|nr:copper resistance protein [Ralstonia syzygii]CCA88034.1 conserved exported hypothetical protein [Ralstonia syzygii R24]
MRRSLRRLWLAGLLVLAFLTVQLAAAAYACAGDRLAVSLAMGVDGMAGMASCPEMAKAASRDSGRHDGLCLEHCQADHKTADHASPQIPAFLPVLVRLVEPTPAPATVSQALAQGDAIARAPPPPIPILNCSFRT